MQHWATLHPEYRVYFDHARRQRAEAMAVLWHDTVRGWARLARGIVSVFRRWRERQKTVHALSSLDHHTLKDIGIDRSEILSFAEEAARLAVPVESTSVKPVRDASRRPRPANDNRGHFAA